MSTTWPSPVRSRCRSATITLNAPASAVTSSVSAIGGSSGAPSGSPLIAANPLIASAIVAKPGRPAYGPSCPKPVMRRITRPGLRLEQVGRREAEALERPGPEVLDEHVRLVEQGAHGGESGLGLEVEDRGPLAPAEQLPHEGLAVAGIDPAHAPGAVAGRALDLDHVGAEVGQVPGHSGAGEHRRHVDDPESFECLHARQDRKRIAWHRPPSFPHLFTPLRIGPVESRNRIVVGAHFTQFTEPTTPGEPGFYGARYARYLGEFARGGAGVVIGGQAAVHPTTAYQMPNNASAWDPAAVPGSAPRSRTQCTPTARSCSSSSRTTAA